MLEGKYTRIHYGLNDVQNHPGGLAIVRNYENAIKTAGGEVVYHSGVISVMKVLRNGVETWDEIQADSTGRGRVYFLHVLELEPMVQVIRIALDVHFATGKAEILPESEPLIAEAVAMLKKRTALRIGVEGHTDHTGTPAGIRLNRTRGRDRWRRR